MVFIERIDRVRQIAVFSDNALVYVADWLDRRGNPGCRPQDAVAVLLEHPRHGWALLSLDGTEATLH
jgi:hypothetical protein